MNDDRFVAEVVRARRIRAQEQLRIACLKRAHRDIPMLSRQIARLARLRCRRCAGIVLSTVRGVKVAHRAGAVSVCWNSEGVDVIDERTVFGFAGETGKVCCHDDAGAVGGDVEGEGAGDCAAGEVVEVGGGEGGAEGEARGVLLDRGVAEEALKGY